MIIHLDFITLCYFTYFLIKQSICSYVKYVHFYFLDDENCKACTAAITFILKNAACYDVPHNHLSNELQQV